LLLARSASDPSDRDGRALWGSAWGSQRDRVRERQRSDTHPN
jgi:hypothetical protein